MLFVKIDGEWQAVRTLDADSHREAFREAMATLPPKYYDKPIKLEQVDPDHPASLPKPRNIFPC